MKSDAGQNNEYQQQLVIKRLRNIVFSTKSDSVSKEMKALLEAEKVLASLKAKREEKKRQADEDGLVLEKSFKTPEATNGVRRGGGAKKSVEVKIKVHIEMETLPTAIYHLFSTESNPLVSCEIGVRNLTKGKTKRIKVVSYIEGYSAKSITTVEITEDKLEIVKQLPTLFPAAIKDITELTKATLYVMVEELESGKCIESTYPLALLARNSAITSYMNHLENKRIDLDVYLGVFVTPNQPDIIRFLRRVADFHPDKTLGGYQGQQEGDENNESGKESVRLQVKAVFDALKDLDLIYVNSYIDFNPDRNMGGQRVRLPTESLQEKQANCLDGTLLYASLLEACSLNPAIVLVPGHAFLAWEKWDNTGEWNYLETTMTANANFEEACYRAEVSSKAYLDRGALTVLPVNQLRAHRLIMPME